MAETAVVREHTNDPARTTASPPRTDSLIPPQPAPTSARFFLRPSQDTELGEHFADAASFRQLVPDAILSLHLLHGPPQRLGGQPLRHDDDPIDISKDQVPRLHDAA